MGISWTNTEPSSTKLRAWFWRLFGNLLVLGTIVMLQALNNLAWADSGKIIPLRKGQLITPTEKVSYEFSKTRFKSDVCQRNLLNIERDHLFSLPRLTVSEMLARKTIRILAIRVEFEKEELDDPNSTGNGLFDMRSQEEFLEQEKHLIDPAPHNRLYFEKHLEALNNYWHAVSKKKLRLEYEVYPRDDTLAYKLSNPISYYGSPDSSFYPIKMLRKFFFDSFLLADSFSLYSPDTQTYKIDFSEYQSFIIFHAGSDRQSDLGELVNYTPHDLFSGFIFLGDSVWVNGGTFGIPDGLIMPETKSQDNRVSAINALLAHEFGHQLGLVDLYNTQTFMTQVGDFSLMDNNAQDVGVDVGEASYTFVSGVLPVYPDAWSLAFLGFVKPIVVTTDQNNIPLIASEMLKEGILMVKIPINSQEYFLLENRQIDLDGDNISFLRPDSQTNVILGPVDGNKEFNGEYDYLLPGSGILIWRVDEGVAYLDWNRNGRNNFEDNQLQCDKDRRFLTLIEADGVIDFGGNYYTGYGQQEDMFYYPHNTSLTPSSRPSSKTNTDANSHVNVTNISTSDTLMFLNVTFDWHEANWPQRFIPLSGVSSLVYADVDNNDETEIFLNCGRFIYAWNSDGNTFIPSNRVVAQTELNGDTVYYPLAIFYEGSSEFVGTPTLGDLNGDYTLEIVAGTADGKIYAWHAFDSDEDWNADLLDGFPVKVGDKISMTPVIADFVPENPNLEICAGTQDGNLAIISNQGTKISEDFVALKVVGTATGEKGGEYFVVLENSQEGILKRYFSQGERNTGIPSINNSPPMTGDFNRDGKLEVMVIGGNGEVHAWDDELRRLPGFPAQANDKVRSAPALGDIDNDGYVEIVFAGYNKIWAYNYNGTLVSDFPIVVERVNSVGQIRSSPILGDIDGDGVADIILGTLNRELVAYNGWGQRLLGFPLSLNERVESAPILLNLDKDEKAELMSVAWDGWVYAWELPNEYDEEYMSWKMWGYDFSHANNFQKSLPEIPVAGQLMPEKLVYNYPNPAKHETTIRFFLREDAKVDIKVYDLSADLVAESFQLGRGNTDNEWVWDCSKFASGVYLCRVEAKSPTETQIVFHKIAIVK